MKRKVMLSLFVIFLAAAIIGGATMAWFSDTAESEEISFQAGTLLIGLEGPDFGDFNLEKLNPGDKWCTDLWVVNDGTKNMKFQGCLFDLEEWTGRDPNNPNEAIDDDMRQLLIDKGYGDTKLTEGSTPLHMTVYLPLDGSDDPTYDGDPPDGYTFHEFSDVAKGIFAGNITEGLCCNEDDRGYVIYEGPVVDGAIFGEHWEPNAPFGPGEAIQYKVCFELPQEAENEYQGAAIRGKFGFGGAQWLEEVDYPECGQQVD